MSEIPFLKERSFFDKVYEIVAKIPEGKVATYGQIARMLGNPKAARQVGFAMASAPEHRNLPCHRVVNRKGEMAPNFVFESQSFQRAMLTNEGVSFLSDGRIDLDKHLWAADDFSYYD